MVWRKGNSPITALKQCKNSKLLTKALVKGDDIADDIYPSTFQARPAYLMKKTGQFEGTVQSLFFLKWSHIFQYGLFHCSDQKKKLRKS